MPELPEVENIVRELKSLKGRVFKDVEVRYHNIVEPNPKVFKKVLLSNKITDIDRRGKLIIIKLESGDFLLVHLKMTGQLTLNNKPSKHTHVMFSLDGDRLLYNDIRKFGFLKVVDKSNFKKVIQERFKFGPEPLSKEFNLDYLEDVLKNRKASIKSILLNQSIVAGLGNIYVDESLFKAGIDPRKSAGKLERGELEKLRQAIKEILKKAIKQGGSTSRDYVRTSGEKGNFQNFHKVYQKTGQPCAVCSHSIERVAVAGRGTHFCPKCQI